MIQDREICVVRKATIDGVSEELTMPLDNQRNYKEFSGCFSYLKRYENMGFSQPHSER
jgi:hypothetical protein